MTRRSPIYNYAARLADDCREAWLNYLASYMEAASDVCRDRVVNERGRRLGIGLWAMFAAPGHAAAFRAYASEELRDYVANHQPLTRNEFERQWLQAEGVGQ